MELRHYLEIVGRRWWMVASAAGITTLLTILLVVQQPWIYGAGGTFVVRPRSVDSAEVVRAIDTLIRGVEINSTYATIARSDAIRDRARERLGSDFRAGDLTVDADVMQGTNVLEISVTGPDPERAALFAEAVGAETVTYVSELEDAFELKPLDLPEVDERPVGPNKVLTVFTGVIFGLMIGVAGAVLADHFARTAEERRGSFRLNGLPPWREAITDSATGTFNDDFFMMRFSEEMARSKHSGRAFAVGLLRFVIPPESIDLDHSRFLRAAADATAGWRREEDVVSHVGGHTLAVLLPDVERSGANEIVHDWKVEVLRRIGSDMPDDFEVTVGVATYTGAEDRVDPIGTSPSIA